jgi:alkylation response protein AidB-like acyl-CoA dehydrogenase
MNTPGIDVRPLHDMTETRNFNEVFFTDVRVPAAQIVGKRGEGWQVANTILGHERELLGDPNIALTRLNNLVQLMQTETISGQRIIDMPVFRDRLMRIQGKLMAMRFNDLRLLSAKVNQKTAPLARMVVKLQGTELRHELEKLAIDAMGEFGLAYGDNEYVRGDGLWQWNYMYYLGLIIGGGTSQIQKNIISERGLNMPKEPKAGAA